MNDEYLRMVLALPEEFFEGWEWREGDQFYIKGYGEDTHVIGDAVLFKKKPHYWKGYLVYGDWDYFKLVPVPSQEQLQSIIKKYITENEFPLTDRVLLCEFMDHVIYYREKEFECCSLDVMWLDFAMCRIYKKTWDGEKWT